MGGGDSFDVVVGAIRAARSLGANDEQIAEMVFAHLLANGMEVHIVESDPDTELRDILAFSGFRAFWADGTPYSGVERAMWAQVADAQLAEVQSQGFSLCR